MSVDVSQMDAIGRLGVAIKRISEARDLLDELDGELDRQLYDDEFVKGCRDNALSIPKDCEHHVTITEAQRQKISAVLALLSQ